MLRKKLSRYKKGSVVSGPLLCLPWSLREFPDLHFFSIFLFSIFQVTFLLLQHPMKICSISWSRIRYIFLIGMVCLIITLVDSEFLDYEKQQNIIPYLFTSSWLVTILEPALMAVICHPLSNLQFLYYMEVIFLQSLSSFFLRCLTSLSIYSLIWNNQNSTWKLWCGCAVLYTSDVFWFLFYFFPNNSVLRFEQTFSQNHVQWFYFFLSSSS